MSKITTPINAWCPACRWQGSWDDSVCPECGKPTRPVEWSRCKFASSLGMSATIVVVESGCKCGAHGPGEYTMPTKTLSEVGLKPGDEFWIVSNLDGVQGRVLTTAQRNSRLGFRT